MSEPDQDNDDTQINFIASSPQKQRWEQYADEAGFRSLSEFLRVAAEKEVNAESVGGGGDVSEDLAESLAESVEGLNRVESRLQDLDDRMATIEREVREDPDLKELANEVFSVLPTKERVIEYEKTAHEAGATPDAPTSARGTVEGIATALDAEEYRVSAALDKLQQDMTQVHTMTLGEDVEGWTTMYGDDDQTRYYKEA